MLWKLRASANWAFARPRRASLLHRFHERLATYVTRSEEPSLAGRMARVATSPRAAPTHQLAHYLFAFDPAAMATFRALALLASHPEARRRALDEVEQADPARTSLPFLRATVLESLRLWPTTPVILREAARDVEIAGSVVPAGTNFVIFAPLLHRDGDMLDAADRFAPEIWLSGQLTAWPLVPFSEGPGTCPARHFVPMLAAGMLAGILSRRAVAPARRASLAPGTPLPGTLDHHSLEFGLREPGITALG
jgi:hypothetical protein